MSKVKNIADKLNIVPYRIHILTGLSYTTVREIFAEEKTNTERPISTYLKIAKILGVELMDVLTLE